MTVTAHAEFFLREESGLAMVEYAVAGALITLAAATAFTNLGFWVWIKIAAIAAVVGLS
jgi:pilus assembly protein Flp/PilA